MSQNLSLYRLQQTDSQIDSLQLQLNTVQQTLENDYSLKQAITQEKTSEGNKLIAERALRQAEVTVQNQRIKIEQIENSLYGGKVQNPKELQDLQNDLGSLNRYLITLEDLQLEAMLTLEEAEKDHQDKIHELEITRLRWAEQNENLTQEQARLNKELSKLSIERFAITKSITELQIGLYDELRQKRVGVAVACITEDACSACGAILTPGQIQAARTLDLARCPTCGRLLFVN